MSTFGRLLKQLFFMLIVRPLTLIYIGLNVRHRERLPTGGPAILAANHNSHLDTAVLMSLFPSWLLGKIRPVAAADYFLRNKWLAWFSLNVIGIIPMARKGDSKETAAQKLATVSRVLDSGNIVIFFPEGTRGEAERLGRFKRGIGLLAQQNPKVPIYPIYLHGLGKALPKGESFLVPFFCDVFVGEPMTIGDDDAANFAEKIRCNLEALAEEKAGNYSGDDEDVYF